MNKRELMVSRLSTIGFYMVAIAATVLLTTYLTERGEAFVTSLLWAASASAIASWFSWWLVQSFMRLRRKNGSTEA